jgi:hypothetical protein
MPISKRDRSFQNIVRDIDIDTLPVEYIQSITLVLENSDRIIFDGEELNQIDEDNIVSILVTIADEISSEWNSPVDDVEIVINYSRIEDEIVSKTKKLLNKEDNDDTGDSSV